MTIRITIRHGVCPNGWSRTDGTECDYTGGHYCDLDAGHRGKCKCPCGFRSASKAPTSPAEPVVSA